MVRNRLMMPPVMSVHTLTAVDPAASFEHQRADTKPRTEFLQRHGQVYVTFSGNDVRQSAVAKEVEILIRHPLRQNGGHVIAVDVVLMPRKSTPGIDRHRK